jgi:pyruvate/2-oxoglutarate dehydrogenase complex dihydrolipoamide dehydrogenase (E3) component
MAREFDVVVIGAGPAGEVIVGRLADRGKQVAIVERDLVGGECSFYACMPSKALLRPAELLHEVTRVPGAAEAVTGKLDVAAVLARRDEVVNNLSDDQQLPWLSDRGVELFRGSGRLDGPNRVIVGDQVLTARDAVVIATGTTAVVPPIPGLREAHAWSNREITTAQKVPKRLLVLGGGIVGVEMAQAWSSLGSSVIVIEAFDRLVAREEPFVGAQVQQSLTEAGVQVLTGIKASAVKRDGDEVTVTLENGETVTGDVLLVAIGRRPLTDDLGLESVGLEAGGYIKVDDHLQVSGVPNVYAIGDANGRSLLTHSGKYQGRIAADHILGASTATARQDGPGAPRVVFTDPQIAAVGITLAAAKEQGIDAVAIDVDTNGTAGSSFIGRGAPGTSRFVVDAKRQILLGVTFVGPEVADFLQAATVAVVAEVPLKTLAHAIAPFPTRSEIWLKFLEAYEAQSGTSVHS